MQSYDFLPENVKYFTRIKEFKYERPNPQKPRPDIQFQSMISLPLPVNMPADAYQEIIRDISMGEVGTTIDLYQAGKLTGTIEEMAGNAGNILGAAGTMVAVGATLAGVLGISKTAASKIGDIVGASILGTAAVDYVGSVIGKTRNPHTAMIFDSMGIRSYNLNFVLAPRDAPESRAINNAFTHLRRMMHPSFVPGLAFVLDYPSMFTVEFAGFPQDRIGIPRITQSFLKNMTINASPQGQVYFKDGWPSLYNIQMEFVELEAKTREYFQLPTTG